MASAKTKKKDTVNIKTFNKYFFKEDFLIEDQDDEGNILKLQCKICSENLPDIRREAKRRNIKGVVLDGILNYADGVYYIHKANIMRHIRSDSLHDWAKKTFTTQPEAVTSIQTEHAEAAKLKEKNQPTIAHMVNKNTKEGYKHLFVTALTMVMEEMPMRDFPKLIAMQRKNGVKFLSGKDSEKSCKEFVTSLAAAVKNDTKTMMQRANFFSGLMDGSQVH